MESWHSLSVQEVFARLSSSEAGLSYEEVKRRLLKFGPNKLPQKKRLTRLHILIAQLKSPLVCLLALAGFVSFFLHDEANAFIILAAVLLTVVFGYFQEQKAEDTLGKLEKMVRYTARVIRGASEIQIDASGLVPGDILILAAGDKVPADTRLTKTKSFETQEASLTGESMSIRKSPEEIEAGITLPERVNMAFMGTIASRGRAAGIVVATGYTTEFGKIAKSLLDIKEEQTPLQKKVAKLTRWVSLVLLGIIFAIFIGGLLRGIELAEIFAASVAAAVAAIPESLVVAVTAILAIGMVRLLRKKALVRKLISAETLGGTTVICVDKTGTLTQGTMKVADVYTAAPDARELALTIGMVASEAFVENPKEDVTKWNIHGDPTETALIRAGIEAGLKDRMLEIEEHILDEMPFESENQYMATLLRQKNSKVIYCKGAPEKILQACRYVYDPESKDSKKHLSPATLEKFKKIHEDFSKNGLRVLAVGFREIGEGVQIDGSQMFLEKISQLRDPLFDVVFVGFIALNDPIREGVKNTMQIARNAGIKVVMITGDHKYTALAVARELGLSVNDGKIIEGRELAAMDDKTLKKEVEKISVYARILPHDKLRIVEAFQANGEVVAMTGDGVNDAPALKRADIGVSMGSGSDVAKEVSDIIILDNNFTSIVSAVEQGRVIFDNLRKVVTFLLSGSFTEIILISGSIIAGLPLPVLAGQILWVNLVEDGLPAFALAYEPKEKDVMQNPPLGRNVPILDSGMKAIIFIVGLVSDLLTLGLFLWLFKTIGDIEYARTMVFAALGTNSLVYIFCIKSLRRSIFHIDLFNNLYLIGAVLFGFAMMFAAIHVPFLQDILRTVPLSLTDWVIIAALGVMEIVGIETAKMVFVSRKK
ncbi:MAG: HAD-IC family P-type ATPase [Candidatus Spechtbacterales bacterium]